MSNVNLDAIIPREDFEGIGQNNYGNLFALISVTSFSTGLFYPFLRKPDFQRETNEWDAKKICEFLESFISGDLIPSIILWRSNSGFYFVIDGAHRLSALASWIYDDYGDGEISRKFYENTIAEEQKEIAQATRNLIHKRIGSYKAIVNSTTNSENERSEDEKSKYLKIAQNLGAFSINVQWVQGDSTKAENSFFKINQQGVQINKTEIKLLESRRKGNCIAARAIKSAGTGHKYWSSFSATNQKLIQEIAEEINKILFSPTLKNPVKTSDLPIAGKITSSQALPLILDFINIVNKIPLDFNKELTDDLNGDETLKYLKQTRKIAWRMNSIHPSSLGLHPIIYFYSPNGIHRPATVYATTAWLVEVVAKDSFKDFIKVRSNFETLLYKYGGIIDDINRKYRQTINSYSHIKEFYKLCIEFLNKGMSIDDCIKNVVLDKKFNYLKLDFSKSSITSEDFSTDRKSAVFIKEAVASALKCKICNGLIHKNSITIDHIDRKEDGGVGSVENGQLAHPYCNTTIKN